MNIQNKKISFVGISNWSLDAAKINRALVLSVPDLDESIAFYKMFGYELLERFSDDGYNWVTLRLNNHLKH